MVIPCYHHGKWYFGKHGIFESLTLESLSLGDSDAVDHLVGGEHVLDLDLLLEVLAGEVDLEYLNT